MLYKYLRRKHRYRIKQGHRKQRIPKELLITARPEYINNRTEFGHWECDLMVFKRGTKINLITLRERQSRYMIAIKNENKEANGTAITLISAVKNIKNHVKSITFDQGSEFKKFKWIKDCIGADIYFCEPGSPHQKGGVENGNGTIRIAFQRDCEVELIKQVNINAVIKQINNRPMKCLNYLSPIEVFNKSVGACK